MKIAMNSEGPATPYQRKAIEDIFRELEHETFLIISGVTDEIITNANDFIIALGAEPDALTVEDADHVISVMMETLTHQQ